MTTISKRLNPLTVKCYFEGLHFNADEFEILSKFEFFFLLFTEKKPVKIVVWMVQDRTP